MIFGVYAQHNPLRVMSYNILNGFDDGKDTLRQRQTAQWISQQSPDVIAFQELCSYTPERLQKEALQWGHDHTALLKIEGYSVGLTANTPIKIVERITTGLWHGMLHCEVDDIHFFVVHLSPDDYQIRRNEVDTVITRLNKTIAISQQYIVLGDFNAHSPYDSDLDNGRPHLLSSYIASDRKSTKYKQLFDNYFDHSVMSKLLAYPMVDVCARYIAADDRYSFPTPILIGRYRDDHAEVIQTQERLDYIMASPALAKFCVGATIANGEETGLLSDHYPVIADFNLP